MLMVGLMNELMREYCRCKSRCWARGCYQLLLRTKVNVSEKLKPVLLD